MQVGSFVLDAPLSQGGQAVIWSGAHHGPAGQRVPVAVKLIHPDKGAHPLAARRFQREIQAVASLLHPGIVTVYDAGVTEVPLQHAGADRIEPGSPWLAMELADSALHRQLSSLRDWPSLRALLQQILRALAHAHARDIIHRDIKPGNILWFPAAPPAHRWRLTDFGIAHLLGKDDLAVRAGSSGYMAPEQRAGRVRQQGPWTDLYAVGCLAFRIVTGISSVQPASMLPGMDLPAPLAQWMMWMLHPNPQSRFPSAADALAGLEQLPVGLSPMAPLQAQSTTWDETLTSTSTSALPAVPPREPAEALVLQSAPALQPLAARWADEADQALEVARAGQLLGAGLGLYSARARPLVGRKAEQDAMWAALLATIREQRPRAVVLQGASGVGKSCLARWLLEHAAQGGHVLRLQATYGPTESPAHGLDAMMGALGEDSDEALAARLLGWLRAQARGGQQPPALLWLDDVQWGPEAVALTRALLDEAELPLLAVLTAQDEALGERPEVAAALERLLAQPRTQRLVPRPLALAPQRDLIASLLPLTEELSAQIEQRTAGNPLFTVQLVEHWVSRGMLASRQGRFHLRTAEAALPEDLGGIWQQRLSALLAPFSEASERGLELAAVLGLEVDADEWTLCCEHDGGQAPWALLEELLRLRLAQSTDPHHRWRFAHGMLREAIVRRALGAGRLQAHHSTVAAMLGKRYPPSARFDERLGRHLLASGQAKESFVPLFSGSAHRHNRGEIRATLRILELMEQANVTALDPVMWLKTRQRRASCLKNLGERAAARALLEEVIDEAEALDSQEVIANSLLLLSDIYRFEPEASAQILPPLERALPIFAALQHHNGLARTRARMGYAFIEQDRLEEAEAILLSSIADTPDPNLGRGMSFQSLHDIRFTLGEWAAARRYLEEAITCFVASEHHATHTGALLRLARTLEHAGQRDAAFDAYHEALAVIREHRLQLSAFNHNMAAEFLGLAGAWPEALAHRLQARDIISRNQPHYVAIQEGRILQCLAAVGDWSALDAALVRLQAWRQGGALHEDGIQGIEAAADHAAAQGQRERARRLLHSLAEMWAFEDYPQQVARIQHKLAALPAES